MLERRLPKMRKITRNLKVCNTDYVLDLIKNTLAYTLNYTNYLYAGTTFKDGDTTRYIRLLPMNNNGHIILDQIGTVSEDLIDKICVCITDKTGGGDPTYGYYLMDYNLNEVIKIERAKVDTLIKNSLSPHIENYTDEVNTLTEWLIPY